MRKTKAELEFEQKLGRIKITHFDKEVPSLKEMSKEKDVDRRFDITLECDGIRVSGTINHRELATFIFRCHQPEAESFLWFLGNENAWDVTAPLYEKIAFFEREYKATLPSPNAAYQYVLEWVSDRFSHVFPNIPRLKTERGGIHPFVKWMDIRQVITRLQMAGYYSVLETDSNVILFMNRQIYDLFSQNVSSSFLPEFLTKEDAWDPKELRTFEVPSLEIIDQKALVCYYQPSPKSDSGRIVGIVDPIIEGNPVDGVIHYIDASANLRRLVDEMNDPDKAWDVIVGCKPERVIQVQANSTRSIKSTVNREKLVLLEKIHKLVSQEEPAFRINFNPKLKSPISVNPEFKNPVPGEEPYHTVEFQKIFDTLLENVDKPLNQKLKLKVKAS